METRSRHPDLALSASVTAPASPAPSPALLGMGLRDLQQWCVSQGQPSFRGTQLHSWIYGHGARSLEAITVLPKAWREQLQVAPAPTDAPAPGWIGRSQGLHRSDSRDGTVKLLLGTRDGLSIETVGIPSDDRLTVCVSTQVGCPMACRFCATGKGGLQRSLQLHEIVDQVLSVREAMERALEAGHTHYTAGAGIKSLREARAVLGDAYVLVRNGEAWLVNMQITEYPWANRWNHEPKRERKLLLHQLRHQHLQLNKKK